MAELSPKLEMALKELNLVKKPLVLDAFSKPNQNKSIHKALGKFLLLPQLFGYMPVGGITQTDVGRLNFTWKSWRCFYAIVTLLGTFGLFLVKLVQIFSNDGFLSILEVEKLFFYLSGVASSLVFLHMARSWPKLVKEWANVERSMTSYGWTAELDGKILVMVVGFMGMALVEYLLLQGNKIYIAFSCKNTTEEALTYFFGKQSYANVFSIFNYNIFLALVLQVINIQLTFTWNFVHLFVMVISVALSLRLKQVTLRLEATTNAQIATVHVWKLIREDYNRLGNLCGAINEHFSNLVLLSFAINVLFILTKLFNSLRRMSNDWERGYFYFSFALLISRTVFVCLYAAKVYEEGRRPLESLSSVAPEVYNKEVERLIVQVGTFNVAISGSKYFVITRGLILKIAGAIVTYELVLIQFNEDFLHNSTDIHSCPIFA